MDKRGDSDIFDNWELTEDILSEKQPNMYSEDSIISMNLPKAKQMSKLMQDKHVPGTNTATYNHKSIDKKLSLGRPFIWGFELNSEDTPEKGAKISEGPMQKPIFIKRWVQQVIKISSMGNKLFLLEKDNTLRMITLDDEVFEHHDDELPMLSNEYEIKQKVKDLDFTSNKLWICTTMGEVFMSN